jgi:hypothetical protein
MQRSFADMKHSERAMILKTHLEAVKKLTKRGRKKPGFAHELAEINCAPRMANSSVVKVHYGGLSLPTISQGQGCLS